MVLWARSSDRTGERRWHLTASLVVAAWALRSRARRFAMVAGGVGDRRHRLLRLSAGDFCDHAFGVVFAGSRQRVSLHQLLRALGSIAGPYGAGWIKSETGSFQNAMYFMAASRFLAAIIAACIKAPNTATTSIATGDEIALQRTS